VSFLAPVFLAALAALAIPLLVHLTHRERREPVLFPSLMFLQRIPFRTHSRQRIRHWLLFLLRAGAVALVAAAFSRPLLPARGVAAQAGARELLVLLDRSASMGARGRWERAQQAARAALAASEGGTAVTLIGFDETAEVLYGPGEDRAAFAQALERSSPRPRRGSLAAALRAAAGLLEERPGPAEIVLISDFQLGSWAAGAVPPPAGAVLRTVDVGDTAMTNASLSGLVLDRAGGAEPRTVVSIRVAASGGAPRSLPVSLSLDGREVQTLTVRVTPGQTVVARFEPLRDPEQPRRARISLPGDDLAADNTHDFVLGPAPRLGVLLLTRADAPPASTVYLRRALGVAREPLHPVTTRIATGFAAGDLQGAAVVVLHDAPFPPGDAGRRLLEWVAAGGGLFVAAGSRGSLASAFADSIAIAARPSDRGESGSGLMTLDRAHPVFGGWDESQGDPLAGTRTWRHRALSGPARTLARFDDGEGGGALAEFRFGAGRVLVWGADLANNWSDLPLQGSFLPLIHGATRYLAGWTPAPPAYIVAEVASLPRLATGAMVVERPDGSRETLADTGMLRVALTDRGFHLVRGVSERGGVPLAANVPPSESEPGRADPAALAAGAAPATLRGAAPAAQVTAAERERRQRLWWYVLAALVAVLAMESLVAYRARRI
jgi:hypothetical protein